MDPPIWIKAGRLAINIRYAELIDTRATWMGEPDGDVPRDAWGEVPPGSLVERTGVVIEFSFRDRKPLRFVDGSTEAEDIRRYVQAIAFDPDRT